MPKLAAPLALLMFALVLLVAAGPAEAAEAFFPALPPATQVTRDLTLQQAVQAGAVKLGAKGGFTGDDVSLELEGKKMKGPIDVTVRVEFTVPEDKTPGEREAIRDLVPYIAQQTEAELNRISGKTSSGDPVSFKLDWKYSEPEEDASSSYHQVLIVNPLKDLPEPDKGYRSEVKALGVPNTEQSAEGVFSVSDLGPVVLAHEALHLAGLPDHYTDVYRYKGVDYALPQRGMAPTPLKEYLAAHKPPLPAPPAGKVKSKNTKGTKKCDEMGTGAYQPCHKISQKDLDWFGEQAGTLVTAEPGELLLNKSNADQNFAVGFKTTVFAAPGETTVANGVSAYCIDHDHGIPFEGLFDLGPKASELTGYGDLAKLLSLNASVQTALDEQPLGMQGAIWNQTDGTPLDSSGFTDEAKALMAKAGVAESTNPDGLPRLDDPNAGSATTGAVGASGEVMPPIAATTVEEPTSVRVDAAQLEPHRFHAGRKLFSDLVIAASGDVDRLELSVERKSGKLWKSAKKLPDRKFEPGTTVLNLGFGALAAAKYRLVLAFSGPTGDLIKKNVPFTVSGPGHKQQPQQKHHTGR